MKSKLYLLGCLLVLLGLLAPALALAQAGGPIDPYESNDDFDHAYGPLGLEYDQYAAYFHSPYDADFYYFDVNQVGTIQVDLTNVGTEYNYGLILYDSDREIASLEVQGTGNKQLTFAMSRRGRYYLMVDVRQGLCNTHLPYLLRVTITQVHAGAPKGPEPGQEAAWARTQLEALGYTLHTNPDLVKFDDGSQAAIALENPLSLDLRLSNDTTWRQATDTWRILDQAFAVDAVWVGLVYQGRYIVFHAVSTADLDRYAKGELTRETLPVSSGIYDTQEGRWLTETEGKGFVQKNFQ